MNSDSIPIDLIIEILSRLPQKSIARFGCVSKLWASIFSTPCFTELFLTRSSAKLRLLLAIEEDGVWSFFSSPQRRQNPYEKSEFHMKFPPRNMRIHHSPYRKFFSCGYTSSLMYFRGACYDDRSIICNPNTGRYVILPYLHRYRKSYSFLGFDPIDKQFKVLFMGYSSGPDANDHRILTLGTGNMKWRKIKTLRLGIQSVGICINGVLYFLGDTTECEDDELSYYVLVCFDVRSEKFKFINLEGCCKLINYKGKLGVIYWKYDHAAYGSDHYLVDEDFADADDVIDELRVWVLEDVEKQEWSKHVYTILNDDDKFLLRYGKVSVVGGTAMGEIFLSMWEYTSKEPFYVFYFNPERNTLKRVEIQGFGEYYPEASKNHSVYTFVDHVGNLNDNDPKLLKSSIYDPQ